MGRMLKIHQMKQLYTVSFEINGESLKELCYQNVQVNSTALYCDIQYIKCELYTFAMAVEKKMQYVHLM